MSHRRTESVLRPAPHPRMYAHFRRAEKLDAIIDAEERARPDPEMHEDFRAMLWRRHALYEDRWRGCPERLCKRHRYCVHPREKCTHHPMPDAPPLTYEQRHLYDDMWQQMLAERAARAAEQER
ncbi:MAG TPA: hypothetical protein VFW22_06500 [Pseudolabrys sp.]|nr:hypothetical protein [Pseudolabrys sp.]